VGKVKICGFIVEKDKEMGGRAGWGEDGVYVGEREKELEKSL